MNNPITQSTDETCNIVQDLLPLYYDDVCSSSSKRLVEKHLKTCERCQNTYNKLKNDSIDSMIKKEADSVLKQHEKKEKSAAYKTGVIIAGLLLIPILITFTVCLSNGGGLNTFAVVTASMLLVAAMTVVPLMAQQKKLTKCIICGVFALLLIFFLLTECIVQMNLCFGLFQLYLDYQLFFFRLSSEELSFHLLCQTKKLLSLCCGIPYGFSSQSLRCVVIQTMLPE